MKPSAVFNDAFLISHEIYAAARELVNSRVPTTQLTSASKFLWRPDLRPRLVEYVADFARAGERALGEISSCGGNSYSWERSGVRQPSVCSAGLQPGTHAHAHENHAALKGSATFLIDQKGSDEKSHNARPVRQREYRRTPRASRLILFRMYYLGGAEYEAARHILGLSERTWSDWAEEVRQRVGAELIRARMYPPARYFREPAKSTDNADKASASVTILRRHSK